MDADHFIRCVSCGRLVREAQLMCECGWRVPPHTREYRPIAEGDYHLPPLVLPRWPIWFLDQDGVPGLRLVSAYHSERPPSLTTEDVLVYSLEGHGDLVIETVVIEAGANAAFPTFSSFVFRPRSESQVLELREDRFRDQDRLLIRRGKLYGSPAARFVVAHLLDSRERAAELAGQLERVLRAI